MDLIEGISNEVLIAFAVSVLLPLVVGLIFVVFFSERNRGQNQPVVHEAQVNNIIEPSLNVSGNTCESDGRRDSSPANDAGQSSQTKEVRSGCETASSGENLWRRAGCNTEPEESQEETMVVRVKHNENIRSFDVTRNVTVIELKRLAFSDEINAGKRVRFVYGGQLLRNDHDPLTSYGVQDNTVVHCVITDAPAEQQENVQEHEGDLDLSRLLIPLLTFGLIMSWYGLITYKHIFTGSSIAILIFLTSLYFMLVYVTIQ